MHKMLKTFSILSLFVACFAHVHAAKAPPAKSLERSKGQAYNLQGHATRINAHHAKMTKTGRANELSQEFLNVHQGMKKGVYKYDLATAQKVMQEVYASRMPAAPKGLNTNLQSNTQK